MLTINYPRTIPLTSCFTTSYVSSSYLCPCTCNYMCEKLTFICIKEGSTSILNATSYTYIVHSQYPPSRSLSPSLLSSGCCLQVDPSNRPTVDSIIAQLYGMADQLGENLDQPSVNITAPDECNGTSLMSRHMGTRKCTS